MLHLGIHIFDLLLVFNSNTWPNLSPQRNISLQDMYDHDLDLSRPSKVKSDGTVGLPIYDSLFVLILSYS